MSACGLFAVIFRTTSPEMQVRVPSRSCDARRAQALTSRNAARVGWLVHAAVQRRYADGAEGGLREPWGACSPLAVYIEPQLTLARPQAFARVVNDGLLRSNLIPVLKTLVEDPIDSTRLNAVEPAVDMCAVVPEGDLKELVAPLLEKLHVDPSWRVRMRFASLVDKVASRTSARSPAACSS
jgi:hypothetical protein